ncbi:hypothetical protein MIND_00898600 [Mycena indigotica]|uniref:F-box domain-containing protein n=1 Tax=Mycena indigotica TaxID=2126181 RepID=A0A8H6SKH1_9AGAR|nr:uncharacterized protein MIND_00898600 [Mycena indigotica]KAF7299485.1 hypothetical protein MIND_00898600 [Mycena indigotica]
MSSPYQVHFGSNYCPQPDESREIKALVMDLSAHAEQLDAEIAQLQKQMDKFVDERRSIQSQIEGHQALLSPMRRIPVDLLQEIFVVCLPSERYCAMSAYEAPMLLGRVCSQWRTTAFSTPALWSSIHIAEPWLNGESPAEGYTRVSAMLAARLEAAKQWLDRSGSLPLSISLFLGPTYGYYPHTLVPDPLPLLHLVLTYAKRWQTLYLHIPPRELSRLEVLSAGELGTITFDHRDSLGNGGEIGWGEWNPPKGTLLEAPALRTFNIQGITVDVNNFPFPCSQLTSLTLGHRMDEVLDSESVLRLIRLCPHLEHLDICLRRFTSSSADATSVESRILRTLALRYSSFDPSSLEILDFLTLPALLHLSVSGRISDPGDTPSFLRFLTRTPRLEGLDIGGGVFETISFAETIPLLPRIINCHCCIISEVQSLRFDRLRMSFPVSFIGIPFLEKYGLSTTNFYASGQQMYTLVI